MVPVAGFQLAMTSQHEVAEHRSLRQSNANAGPAGFEQQVEVTRGKFADDDETIFHAEM